MTIDAPRTTFLLALYVARRTIRQMMQDDGYKPRDVTVAMLDNAARHWLASHPEALELAAERITSSPRLRAMAECEARERARAIQKTLRQAQPKSSTTPMLVTAAGWHPTNGR